MIDWYSVGFGALWIIGLGFVTAALSFAYYIASQQKMRLRRALGVPTCRIMIDLGLVFFCLGWAGGASAVWERLLWAVLGLIFAVQTWQARKMSHV
jgi:ABC-type iron transport system FetAB permease component